jgi:hypothetical protein
MTLNTSQLAGRARTITIVALTVVLLSASARASEAAADDRGIVGTWTVQVTLRDCASGAPLGPPINSLVTFHRGGTLSESVASVAFAPGQRSPGHGVWSKRGHTVAQEMIALVLFDTQPNLPGTPTFDPTKPVSPGFFAGWSTVSHSIRLTSVDQIESSGTNSFYRANGELYRSGCSTATGQRF